MIRFDFTCEDMSNLGLPQDIRKEVYIAYYYWVKEDKPISEFTCTVERSIEYIDKFNKEWEWL